MNPGPAALCVTSTTGATMLPPRRSTLIGR